MKNILNQYFESIITNIYQTFSVLDTMLKPLPYLVFTTYWFFFFFADMETEAQKLNKLCRFTQ